MSNDVLITPASRKIEFKDSSANVDAKIETDASGNLVITNAGGDISIGDTTSDIFVGDGTNNVDIVFEQDGEIRGTSGVTVTLGASGSNVRMATDLNLNSNDITNVNDLTVAGNLTVSGTTTTVSSTNTTIGDSLIELNSGLTGANAKDIGLIFERGSTGNNAAFFWDESGTRFRFVTTTDTGASTTITSNISEGTVQAGSFVGNGSQLSSLNASNLSSGTVASARLSLVQNDIPSLAASKITSGTFADARIPSLAASKITSGTLDTARLPNPIHLSGGNAIIKLQETDVTNSPTWWHVADGGNYSIRLNNTGAYPIQITTDSDNDAVSEINFNYTVHLNSQKLQFGGESTSYIQNQNKQSTDVWRFQTEDGYIDIGSENTSWAHMTTDRASFYMNPKLTVQGNIEPYLDSSHNLGTNTLRWANVYADTLYGDGSNITGITATDNTKMPLAGGTFTGDVTIQKSATPTFVLYDNGNAGGGGASAKILFSNTGGNAMGIGYTGDSTADSDMIISTNAGGTYGGYLGLAANGITDASADIILEPKGSVRIAGSGDLRMGTTQVITSAGNWVGGGNISEFTNDSGYLTASSTQSKYLRSDADDTATGNIDFARASFGTSSLHTTGGTHGVVTDSFSIHSGGSDLMYMRPSALRSDNGFFQWQTYNGGNGGDIELQPYGGSVTISTGSATNASGNGLRFQTGSGSYSDGRYQHRFRKRDEGGGIPLYLDQSDGTANSFTAIARFGNYTNNPEKFALFGDAKITGNLNIGADDTTPQISMLFDDHASGGGWDTRIEIGKSDDLTAGTGVFPTYVPAGAYGMQVQANSDGVFFGMEEYSTGNFRPIIQWGDDDTDTPFRIKHENGSEFTVSYNGIATATTRLSAPQVYATVASGTAPLVVTSTTLVSNLNADRLDSQHGSYYLDYNNFSNTPTIPSLSGYATESYVTTQVNNLIDSAPGALNTLNELAAAIGDDASFSTTVTNSIASKLPLAGGTMTGAVTMAGQTWNGDITWNNAKNILVGGESSIDVSGSGYFQIWDSAAGAAFLKCDVGVRTEIGIAGSRGLKVYGEMESSSLDVNGNGDISGALNVGGNLTIADQIRIGDDCWLEDYNVANSVRVKGNQNNNIGFITFGQQTAQLGCNNTSTLSYNGNNLMDSSGNVYGSSLYVTGKKVLDLQSNSSNTERGPWNPLVTSLRNSGRRLYPDEDFRDGSNSIGVYNNSGGGTVTHTREDATTNSGGNAPNSSGKVIRIYYNGGTASPGFGGFIQTIPSEDNHTFVQIFQAKLPTGKNLVIAENAQGSNNRSYFLTDTAGTGKWEWYARVSHCGNSGTFSSGGHIYVTGGSGAFSWYLASCTVIDVTEPNMGETSFFGNIVLEGDPTTSNAARTIDFTGYDKEGTTDFSDRAYISHTTNTGGHSGSVLLISSQNDSNDGIAFSTNGSSYLKHNSNNIFTDGYHPNADKWTTARTITLGGDLTGNVSIDGSANVTLTAAVVDDSHNHVISNIDGLQTALDGKAVLSGNNTFTGDITVQGNQVITNNVSARVKFSVWSGTTYGIGMQPSFTFGSLQNEYAMCFQMNDQTGRGFWWGDTVHTNAQGAMALDTEGRLTVARSVRLGFGESDTTDYDGNIALQVKGNMAFGEPGGGTNTNACWLSFEGNTDGSGEGSGRLFFREHNSSTAAEDSYGMSLGYRGGSTTITSAGGNSWTGLASISNGQWGMWGHDGNSTGALVMYGDRAATYVDFAGNNIQGITDAYIADQIIHTGDTNTYMQFHAADQWRVVCGGTEFLEVNGQGVHVTAGDLLMANQEVMRNSSSNLKIGDVDDDDQITTMDIKVYAGNGRIYLTDGEIFFNGTSNSTAGFKMIQNTGAFHSNGDVIAYSSTLTASDERLKENIEPLEGSLNKILKLKGVKYDWKNKERGTNQIGLIAQEVEKVVPEVVNTIEDSLGDLNDMKVVNYSALVPVLVEAVKMQQKQIDRLSKLLEEKS